MGRAFLRSRSLDSAFPGPKRRGISPRGRAWRSSCADFALPQAFFHPGGQVKIFSPRQEAGEIRIPRRRDSGCACTWCRENAQPRRRDLAELNVLMAPGQSLEASWHREQASRAIDWCKFCALPCPSWRLPPAGVTACSRGPNPCQDDSADLRGGA